MNGPRELQARVDAKLERKTLGRFYTPPEIANALATWAIRSPDDKMLDPSYGGCAFLHAAAKRLGNLGSADPVRLVYGVDVDGQAIDHLNDFAKSRPQHNFLHQDFFDVKPRAFGSPFDTVIGNPPYVRHHALSEAQIARAARALEGSQYSLQKSAGYWAYFFLYSLSFLKHGGRMAMLVPASLLNADYAGPVRKALATEFSRVRIGITQGRIIPDAQQAIVIVLAEGFAQPNRVSEIGVFSHTNGNGDWAGKHAEYRSLDLLGGATPWRAKLLHADIQNIYDSISARPDVHRLGDLASVRIGIVTGANRFFILTRQRAKQLGLRRAAFREILDGAQSLSGLLVDRCAMEKNLSSDRASLLLVVPKNSRSKAILRYVRSEAGRSASSATKCQIRTPWYRIEDLKAPDAFLPYVNHRAARIAINSAGCLCSNAIHRIWWNDLGRSQDHRVLALASLTSLAGLSAELNGRNYGGGALKLEPGEACRLLVPAPDLNVQDAIDTAHELLLRGDWNRAREVADQRILREGLGLSEYQIQCLKSGQDTLRNLRKGEWQETTAPVSSSRSPGQD